MIGLDLGDHVALIELAAFFDKPLRKRPLLHGSENKKTLGSRAASSETFSVEFIPETPKPLLTIDTKVDISVSSDSKRWTRISKH